MQLGEKARKFFRPAEKVNRSTKPCRLGGHLVKTKILTEVHCSLFKIDLAWGEKNDLWCLFSYLKSYVPIGLIELLKLYIIIKAFYNLSVITDTGLILSLH